jgi:hypothetical protein
VGRRLRLESDPTNSRPGWLNHWDMARIVDNEGKQISNVLVGDKVKITFLDPYPDEIDDEIPLEIIVTTKKK